MTGLILSFVTLVYWRLPSRSVEGKRAVVRNGYLPERMIQTGLGDIAIKVPKVRDRSAQGVKFNSALVPPCVRVVVHQSMPLKLPFSESEIRNRYATL